MSRSNNWPSRYFMNTRLDYLWEKVSLFTQFSDLAKIFEPIFFKISLKTGPIFDHPLLVKIGSEIRKSVQNRKTDIFSSPGRHEILSLIFPIKSTYTKKKKKNKKKNNRKTYTHTKKKHTKRHRMAFAWILLAASRTTIPSLAHFSMKEIFHFSLIIFI